MLEKIEQLERKVWYLPYLYAVLAQLSMSVMQICMRVISQWVPPCYALYWRGVFLIVINWGILWYRQKEIGQRNSQIWSLLWKRSILSSVTLICFLGSIVYMPISIASSLFNLAPIITHFLEIPMYGKPLHLQHFLLTVFSFLGVILIIQPTFLFGSTQPHNSWLFILPLAAAFTNSLSFIYLHNLKRRISNQVTLHYFYIAQTLISALCHNANPLPLSTNPPITFFLCFAALVICAYTTQLLTYSAIALKKPSYILPFGYVLIVTAFFTDIFLYGQSFNSVQIIGIILTSCGLLSKLFIKEK